MTPDTIFNLFGLFNLWLFIKLFVLVLLFFHFVLAALVIRQTSLMTQVLGTNISPLIKLITLIHALAVAVVFFLAVILI